LLPPVHAEVPRRPLLAASRQLDVGQHWKLLQEAGDTCLQPVSATACFHSTMNQPCALDVGHVRHSLTLHTALDELPSDDTAKAFWLENRTTDDNMVHLDDPSFSVAGQPVDCIHTLMHCHNACASEEQHYAFQ